MEPVNTVAKWGNSLAVRIPVTEAKRAGFQEGTEVQIHAKAGRLIIQGNRLSI
ncbi:MAG: AbrB/MazE/SpoVT family DNA-binding domain-containing protein [Candidatus Binataceae bacterium]